MRRGSRFPGGGGRPAWCSGALMVEPRWGPAAAYRSSAHTPPPTSAPASTSAATSARSLPGLSAPAPCCCRRRPPSARRWADDDERRNKEWGYADEATRTMEASNWGFRLTGRSWGFIASNVWSEWFAISIVGFANMLSAPQDIWTTNHRHIWYIY